MNAESTEPPALQHSARPTVPFASFVVWGAWLGLTVWQAWFVWNDAGDMAFRDEVQVSPWVFGDRPVTARWLWSQHFEHRIPLPKALYLIAMKASGDRYRAAAMMNVMFLSASAFVLIRRTSRTGGTSWLDLGFPIVLLTLSHWQNLLSGFQVVFTVTVFLATCVFVSLTCRDRFSSNARVIKLALPLVLLPLCGAAGLLLGGVIGVWLFIWSIFRRRAMDAGARRGFWTAAAVLLVCGLYLIDLADPFASSRVYDGSRVVEGVVGFLTTTFGPAGWGDAWALPAALLLAIALVAPWLAWRARRIDGARASALCVLAVSLALLAAAVGTGRASIDPAWARWPRYATLTALLPCLLVLCLRVCASPAWQRIIGAPALALMLLVTPADTRAALAAGRERSELYDRIASDARDGTPPEVLTARYAREINPALRTLATFNRMKRAGVGPWRSVPPAVVRTMPDDFQVTVSSPETLKSPIATFSAPVKGRIWAICVTAEVKAPAVFRFRWSAPTGERVQDVPWNKNSTARTIWIDAAVDSVRFESLDPAVPFDIRRVEWWTGK